MVLTGGRQDVAHMLATIPAPSLEELVELENTRLRGAFSHLTPDGKGIDILHHYGKLVGRSGDGMAGFITANAAARGAVYLSDAYVVRDLFFDDKHLHDESLGVIKGVTGEAKNLRFLPTTTWSKPGEAVFRFCVMHNTIPTADGERAQLRAPVVMLDNTMLDEILASGQVGQTILGQLREMASVACHDYIHTSFIHFTKDNAPEPLAKWDDDLRKGKRLWRDSPLFVMNYEVLTSIGHRQIMDSACEENPAFRKALVQQISAFSDNVQKLCDGMADPLQAARMEQYLMTNYMRFAYHALEPDAPELDWVNDKYRYVKKLLNIDSGKGLISVLHAHEGVPNSEEGKQDVAFGTWVEQYMEGMKTEMASQHAQPKLLRRGKSAPTSRY